MLSGDTVVWWAVRDPWHHVHVLAVDEWDALRNVFNIPVDYLSWSPNPVYLEGYTYRVIIESREDGYRFIDPEGKHDRINVDVIAHPVPSGCGDTHTDWRQGC